METHLNNNKNSNVVNAVKLVSSINITKIVSIHYFEFDKNFHFAGEMHDYWEMVYVDSGNVHVKAGEENHILGQGEIIFHKPNEFHTISADKKTPSNVFVITFVAASKNMEWFKNKKTILPKDLRPYIKTLIKEGGKTFDLPFNNPEMSELTLSENQPFGGLQIIRTTLEQLLIMLIRTDENETKSNIISDSESSDNHLVNAVIQLLEDNIYGKITVEEICKKLNYSKTYISKIFNKNCGCTIIEFYTKLKIKEAKKLIREKYYSFTEISNMLYFSNPHYFSRVFKKNANMTPSEYLHAVSM